MIVHATSAVPWGVDARLVRVEAHLQDGPAQLRITGLPDASVQLPAPRPLSLSGETTGITQTPGEARGPWMAAQP